MESSKASMELMRDAAALLSSVLGGTLTTGRLGCASRNLGSCDHTDVEKTTSERNKGTASFMGWIGAIRLFSTQQLRRRSNSEVVIGRKNDAILGERLGGVIRVRLPPLVAEGDVPFRVHLIGEI